MDERPKMNTPFLVFYSYAPEDESLQQKLENHLAILQRQKVIHSWQKRQIIPGDDWTATVDRYLKKVDVILLLVSPDYIASDYCYGIEMQRALELHEAHQAHVIPILLRPVEWKGTPFAHLHPLPRNAKPITLWRNRDQALANITSELRDVLQQFSEKTHQLQATIEQHLLATQDMTIPREKKPVFFLPINLPDLYIGRFSSLEKLRQSLCGTADTTTLTTVIHGMGGLGKTVLARAACNDPVLRKTFADGILWATVGQNPKTEGMHPRVQEMQSNWITALHGNSSAASNETLGKVELQRLLEDRAMLIVLDDVWDLQDIEFLRISAPRCHTLITTRDRTIAGESTIVQLDRMSREESRELLKIASKGKLQDNALADTIAENLGYLPLALDIVARLFAEEFSWEEIEEVLTSNISTIEYGKKTLATLTTSVSFLQPEEQERYHELIVFPQDEKIPRSAVAKLWKHMGLSAYQTSSLLAKLRQRALLQDSHTLHDLHYYYLQSVVPPTKQQSLHNVLLDVYNGPSAWEAFPDNDDFYIWRRLAYHLDRASRLPELKELLTSGEYLKAKISRIGVADTLGDYAYLVPDQHLPLVVGALQLGAYVLDHDHDQFRNQIYGRLGTLASIHIRQEDKPAFLLDSRTLTWPDAPALSSFQGHKGSVFGCAFNLNGQQVLSASADSSLRIWDIQTGKTLFTLEG